MELPPSLARVDPVFHISKIEPFIPNDPTEFPGRTQEAPAPVVNAEGAYEAELESILDMRWHQGQVQVLCKYLGYPVAEAEWQTYSHDDPNWDEDRALVVQYQSSHPSLVRPTKKVSKKVQAARDRAATRPLSVPTSTSTASPVPSLVSAGPSRRSTRLKGGSGVVIIIGHEILCLRNTGFLFQSSFLSISLIQPKSSFHSFFNNIIIKHKFLYKSKSYYKTSDISTFRLLARPHPIKAANVGDDEIFGNTPAILLT